ncbi:mevalonate kinase [Suhomyces tanzawaensis NRRL Y-17324]|uniref:Mevalonate kinase n=1 Tax=Suhomyces tanzawaensis NRRL Y-17324 TaxID=984487 RepID=A0A1E4SD42_9ASCO|nr:mevalonate kinase [Suhomyces tanzawaensis NRRL Y-17324]ODV77434.1 mevalonate kinase [Suhomyces tanzawaensis NRRL Y-17324]
MTLPFFVSAPGKVIIFGEHSAVYSKPAIAAALSLRAYLLVTPSKDPKKITLNFPDVELSHSWNKEDIPWDEIQAHVQFKDGRPLATEELVPEITNELSGVLSDLESSLHYVASHCFLYMYTHLCSKEIPGMTFSIRSTLPIGAGLGSSASVSVCLASALAVLGGHVQHATLHQNDKVTKNHNPEADFIDSWSLIGEKCYHGNPSGIDNAVATYGGAVMYQRMKNPSQPSVRTNMRNLPPLKLLLTNTKIPRSTAYLVGQVGKINEKYPKTSASILEAMEHLANDAYQIMTRPFFGKEEKEKMRELVNINHGLLVALGVSHPSLENIKIISEVNKIGATKLTGAGGGGCAITLVNDDVAEETIQRTIDEFKTHGYETYETTLGGKGVASLQFDLVKEDLRDKVFSDEAFASYKDRFEIDGVLSVDNLEGWRFW